MFKTCQAYVSICQHTSAYVSVSGTLSMQLHVGISNEISDIGTLEQGQLLGKGALLTGTSPQFTCFTIQKYKY